MAGGPGKRSPTELTERIRAASGQTQSFRAWERPRPDTVPYREDIPGQDKRGGTDAPPTSGAQRLAQVRRRFHRWCVRSMRDRRLDARAQCPQAVSRAGVGGWSLTLDDPR